MLHLYSDTTGVIYISLVINSNDYSLIRYFFVLLQAISSFEMGSFEVSCISQLSREIGYLNQERLI